MPYTQVAPHVPHRIEYDDKLAAAEMHKYMQFKSATANLRTYHAIRKAILEQRECTMSTWKFDGQCS